MGQKKKRQRFAENKTFPHLFQLTYQESLAGFPMQGKWKNDFFRSRHSLVLELGCGKGDYTVGLAKMDPEKNYIGIDIKGARLWRGAKTVSEDKIPNVAFVRSRIELLERFFGAGEVDEIWITFPDPHLRNSRAKKRLTHPAFLNRYRKVLAPEHYIHLKTDNPELYQFTLETLRFNGIEPEVAIDNLYQSGYAGQAADIQTFYEQMWLEEGRSIHYLKFRLDLSQELKAPAVSEDET